MKLVIRSYREVDSHELEELTKFGLDIQATKMVFDDVTEPSGQMVTFYLKNGAVWTVGASPEKGISVLSVAEMEPYFEKNPLIIETTFEVDYE